MAVAELNNIIMVFPQVKITVTNPRACWDWYGYTNDQYCKYYILNEFNQEMNC